MLVPGKNVNIIQRHYKVIILNGTDVVDYCYSNTLAGVLDYVNMTFSKNYNRNHDLELDFKIIRYEFGNSQNSLAEDLSTT